MRMWKAYKKGEYFNFCVESSNDVLAHWHMLRLAWVEERNLEGDLEKARLRFEKYLCELEEGE